MNQLETLEVFLGIPVCDRDHDRGVDESDHRIQGPLYHDYNVHHVCVRDVDVDVDENENLKNHCHDDRNFLHDDYHGPYDDHV